MSFRLLSAGKRYWSRFRAHFSPKVINPSLMPRHIAIVMDGNRRWSKKQKISIKMGHRQGADTLARIVESAAKWGVKTLTVFAFSTENWDRSPEEVHLLMDLFLEMLNEKKEGMIREGVALHAIGDLSRLPSSVQQSLKDACSATHSGKKMNLVLALNYGGRNEMCRAIDRMIRQVDLSKTPITESLIAKFLDTAPFGDPDLVIRTSGEMRVSNFLLWQISYSEFYITDVFWPAFTQDDLLRAICNYQTRQRRFGGNTHA